MNQKKAQSKPRKIRQNRVSVRLPGSLEARVAAYAMAAAASGAALVTAQPAAAEVVYTPAHTVFNTGVVYIDLNHDGINDLALSIYNLDSEVRRLNAHAVSRQNGVLCSGSSGYPPLALKAGYVIGRVEPFGTFDQRGAPAVDVVASKFGTYVGGPFANAGDRYLGLKFKLNGKAHYGWALIKAEAGVSGNRPQIKATLLSYAYETVAGRPIEAGEGTDSGETANALPEAGTLGMLALGWQAW